MKIDLATAGATPDRHLEALADESRRHVLASLCEADGPVTLTELAVDLADAEREPATVAADEDPVRRREIALYHRHAPKLDEAGLVEFDAARRTVTLAAEFDDADEASELLAA